MNKFYTPNSVNCTKNHKNFCDFVNFYYYNA